MNFLTIITATLYYSTTTLSTFRHFCEKK